MASSDFHYCCPHGQAMTETRYRNGELVVCFICHDFLESCSADAKNFSLCHQDHIVDYPVIPDNLEDLSLDELFDLFDRVNYSTEAKIRNFIPGLTRGQQKFFFSHRASFPKNLIPNFKIISRIFNPPCSLFPSNFFLAMPFHEPKMLNLSFSSMRNSANSLSRIFCG